MKYSVLGFGFIANSHRHTKVDIFTKYTKCINTATRTLNKYELYYIVDVVVICFRDTAWIVSSVVRALLDE